MNDLDQQLIRANELFFAGDTADEEIRELMPGLIKAGYVEETGQSASGFFLTFTPTGVARGKELGIFAESAEQ